MAPSEGEVAAAGDEVSAGIASLFSSHAQDFQALSTQAVAFHAHFVQLVSGGAAQYASAEAASRASLAQAVQNLPNYGYGNTGSGNYGVFNTGNQNFGIGNIGNYNLGIDNTGSWNFGIANFSPNNLNANINFSNPMITALGGIGIGNTGIGNTGFTNLGFFNYGSDNTGLPISYLGFLGVGNTGFHNEGLFNFGSNNIGFFNTGSTNIGIGITGTDRIGIGPLNISNPF